MQLAAQAEARQPRLANEYAFIDRIGALLPRSLSSRNEVHQTDSELVDVGLPEAWLAATTDTVAEEIAAGLYTDPYEIGWVSVVASLSDLAAVGARPLGILSSISMPGNWSDLSREQLLEGIGAALRAHATGSLGGDTNSGPLSITVTALGLVDRARVLRRSGARPGDHVYVSGPCGAGAAYAFRKLFASAPDTRLQFRPRARLTEAAAVSGVAASCMDTSDGLLAALDQLSRSSDVDIRIEDLEAALDHGVRQMLAAAALPAIAAAAAIHGEFELCLTVSPARQGEFLSLAQAAGFTPIRIGSAVAKSAAAPQVTLGDRPLDTGRLRELWSRTGSSSDYLRQLLAVVAGPGGGR
jgi:thiamine-monophosphate kinase